MTDKIVVYTTCGTAEEARKIAAHVVEKRVAACVAVTPGVTSVYRWKGAVETAEEWSLAIKSRRDLFGALCAELRAVHSYETPEILAVAVVDGGTAYLEWMDRELAPGPAGVF